MAYTALLEATDHAASIRAMHIFWEAQQMRRGAD